MQDDCSVCKELFSCTNEKREMPCCKSSICSACIPKLTVMGAIKCPVCRRSQKVDTHIKKFGSCIDLSEETIDEGLRVRNLPNISKNNLDETSRIICEKCGKKLKLEKKTKLCQCCMLELCSNCYSNHNSHAIIEMDSAIARLIDSEYDLSSEINGIEDDLRKFKTDITNVENNIDELCDSLIKKVNNRNALLKENFKRITEESFIDINKFTCSAKEQLTDFGTQRANLEHLRKQLCTLATENVVEFTAKVNDLNNLVDDGKNTLIFTKKFPKINFYTISRDRKTLMNLLKAFGNISYEPFGCEIVFSEKQKENKKNKDETSYKMILHQGVRNILNTPYLREKEFIIIAFTAILIVALLLFLIAISRK